MLVEPRGGPGNLHSGDKWIADLIAAILAASRRQDEQATAPEPQPGVQGEVALAAVKGEKTLAELAQQHDVHPNLINQWRARLLEGTTDVFGAEPATAEPAVDVTVLHAKIGELTLANDFWPVRSGRQVCCRAQSDDRP